MSAASNRLVERGLLNPTDVRPLPEGGVGEPVRVRFVARPFYSADGRRFAAKEQGGELLICEGAPCDLQRQAIALHLRRRRPPLP
jgi:hypothetical protein